MYPKEIRPTSKFLCKAPVQSQASLCTLDRINKEKTSQSIYPAWFGDILLPQISRDPEEILIFAKFMCEEDNQPVGLSKKN